MALDAAVFLFVGLVVSCYAIGNVLLSVINEIELKRMRKRRAEQMKYLENCRLLGIEPIE